MEQTKHKTGSIMGGILETVDRFMTKLLDSDLNYNSNILQDT